MPDLEIPAQAWLDTFEHDYLASFIREGGASTKVIIVDPDLGSELAQRLRDAAERHGLVATFVDQAVPRVYYMDRLFNSVARQIDWDCLARDFMRAQLTASGYSVPGDEPLIDRIAETNSIDIGQVRITVQQLLSSRVVKDYDMARDFRLAMNQLCRGVVERDQFLADLALRVIDWLKGDLRTLGALRQAMIFERINRYNARSMFTSLGHWLRLVGKAGLLLVVDVSRFASGRTLPGPEGTEIRPPSRPATMDMYEMMRQCIDGTDEMTGLAICFLTGPEFVQDDTRGMRAYSALEQRLTDDVRDRHRGNPLAPMVRLERSWS
jgi:hypothetical protein